MNGSLSRLLGIKSKDNKSPLLVPEDSPLDHTRGSLQPATFRDSPAAIFFYLHLVVIITCGLLFGLPAFSTDASTSNDGLSVITILSLCTVFSFFLSTTSLTFMMRHGKVMIDWALKIAVGITGGMALMLMIAQSVLGIVALVAAGCMLYYWYYARDRIPFASASLNTGLTAVKSNFGVILVAYLNILFLFSYIFLWALAIFGISQKLTIWLCDDAGDDCVVAGATRGGITFFSLLMLFWSQQVIKNTVHVTVAGTVGTWWFDPGEALTWFSPAVKDSYKRATTYSFGSICFGSLLVALVQTLQRLVDHARQGDNDSPVLLCCLQCLLSCIQGVIEYFNKWAFIYVGLYGYTYIEAGKNVMILFEQRGFTNVIVDYLVSNVLGVVSAVIALATGGCGYVFAYVTKAFLFSQYEEQATFFGFSLGFLIGLMVSSIMMGVVESAVNTVIVCFAEAPREFRTNHATLYEEMMQAWKKAYPEIRTC